MVIKQVGALRNTTVKDIVLKKIAQQNFPLTTARSTVFYIGQCPIQELEGMFLKVVINSVKI